MNRKFSAKAIHCVWMGALLLSALAAYADTQVTFQIDMTAAISNAQFYPGEGVAARGTFDGWGTPGFVLTNNPGGVNSNLFSGTYDDTADANGGVMDWQFVILTNGSILSVNGFSVQADADNYCAKLPATSGASLVVPIVFWDDGGPAVSNAITFQVDMAEQLHLGNFSTNDNVYGLGSFEGWTDANFPLTNNPALNVTNGEGTVTSLVYEGTYTNWGASPGAAAEYKFVYNNGSDQYESPTTGDPDNNNNRFFMNEPQSLPLVAFSDIPFADTVTNNVTFVIDMSVQEDVGNFNAAANTVEIHGDYNLWGNGTTMLNTNANSPSLYYTTIQYVEAAGQEAYFKYVIQPGTQWENVSAANSIGGNRHLNLLSSNGTFTDGPVFFSDEGLSSLSDFVTVSNCMVTFTVDMSPATNADSTFNSGGPFILGFDNVYLNGINGGVDNSYWTWSALDAPSQYQMTEIGSGPLYTLTVPVNEGQPLDLVYKYGIDGQDDEAASGANHMRYIRSLPDYTMPTDVFGSQGATTSTEIAFGDLTIGRTNDQLALSWLGGIAIHLQTTSSLNPGTVWTNLNLTDGTNLIVAPGGMVSTNYTIGQGDLFFRLVGP
jgi:hypothetical protein